MIPAEWASALVSRMGWSTGLLRIRVVEGEERSKKG